MASLQDALTNVRCLQDFSLPDEQPTIEPEPTSIVYEVSFDTNFADRTAFITGSGRYNEEATICSRLNVILEEGEQYAGMLYTWRCLSRAVPAIKNNEQANRMEIYEKTIEVLGPEVEKAKEFLRFMQKAATSFTDEVKTLSHPERRRDFISEYYLLTLARLVNMFSTLDALKNMKACINNDLACYRRAESILRRGAMDAFAIEESQNLSLFFATNNSITNMIKKNLEEVPGFEEVLVETINLCCTHYEAQMYIVPEEKYQLLKAIGYGMVLLDGNVVNINKLKKLNIPRIDRIFKSMPVAPLYGDVQIKLPLLVKGLPHHDSSRWNCTSESLDDKLSISITDKLDQIRQEHVQIMSRLARYNNEIITSSQFTQNDHTSREMYEMAVKAVQLLTSWSTSVMEMYSWKLLHPTNHYDNKECPAEAGDYEKATRYNYTSDEKYALVEVIAMIKGLALLMQKMEKHFSQAIRRHIYVRMQEFVQVGIRDSIRHTAKKKKHKPKTILLGLRDVCVDWLNGEPRDDPATRGDKDPKGGFKVDVPRKAVRPSSTQLYMMRTMLESLISDKTGAEKKALKVELKDSSIPEFESFHRASFYYAKMLDLSSTLHDCNCLPGLWFREFFLELTMGERIQFPIEMSLPWILADHILESKEAHMMEYILYPLDLYSDSGHYALHHFKKQFLYDEVEAEVNLCFDQMVYKLSEQIFSHFKQLAASIYLDKRFRAESTAKLPYPNPNRYETILKQRHVQLLGRSIDLNRLLAQRLGASMLKAMDTVIHKFESSDLTAVVELETLMEINRLTHSLLMEHVTLDPFPVMLNEANQAINSPHGRITLHIFWELHYDFLPNFCYNSTTDRFVRSKLPHDPQEREHHPKGPGTTTMLYGTKHLREAYQSALSMYENFVGPEHFATMSRLLGYQGTSMVIQQLLNIMNSSIHNTVNPYIQALGHGMPQKCKLPLYDYGSKGVLGFYYAQLTPVIQYGELRTEVFQVFKEIGNTVLFCLLLEKSMSQEEIIDTLEGSPFLGTYPKPFIKEEESAEMVKQKLEQQYATIQLQPLISSKGSTPQKFISEESVLLTKERLCVGLTLFEGVMRRIKSYITDPVWTGPLPSNGVMNVDECQEFHRIWSAIQFVYCIPLPTGQLTVEECFGEGLHWAGCTFIVLLGQQKRFEALDFCYHLMRVHEVDRQGDIVSGVNVKKMVERIKAFYQLNNQIFATLNKCLTTSDIIGQQAREYQPPIYQPSSSV